LLKRNNKFITFLFLDILISFFIFFCNLSKQKKNMSGFVELKSVKTQKEIDEEIEPKRNAIALKFIIKIFLVVLVMIPFCYATSIGWGLIELIFTQKTDVIECYRSFHIACVAAGCGFWFLMVCIGFICWLSGRFCISGTKGLMKFGFNPTIVIPPIVHLEEEGDEN
jgi:hypothetical protein